MSVAVVVPFRGGCPHRESAWAWVRERYATVHPEWEVIEACPAQEGEWCKAAAVNPAVAACDAEIVVQADADVWTDGLGEAVTAIRAGAPWAIPHRTLRRLNQGGTAALLRSDNDWASYPLDQPTYKGIEGGGIVVASAQVLTAIPLDLRFIGWGQDDEAHAMALRRLAGKPWRGRADLLHLWHPPQERMRRRRGSPESWALRIRYADSRDDPAAMAALIEESRVASQADEHPRDDHPAIGVG
jgi:hypothetical protein